MKPEPKFVPGEWVVIESPTDKHLNGVVTVVARLEFGLIFDFLTKQNTETWVYYCGVMPPKGEWLEYDLRKLPPNSATTFDADIWQPKRDEVKG